MAKQDYQARGCDIRADEIFISDGAKSDSGNIQEIFARDNKIAVCDPVYPVYVDTNVMAGRAGDYDPKTETWSDVIYMPVQRRLVLRRNSRGRRRTSSIFASPTIQPVPRSRRISFRNGWIMPIRWAP